MTQEPYVQGHVRRDFVEYDHPAGAYTLKAHVVTDKTKGEVSVPGGGVTYAIPGQVLVETSRPGTYDVHEADVFEEMGLEAVTEQQDLGEDEDTTEPEPAFDPSAHTAAEVRRYLRKLSASDDPAADEEIQRVVDAERDGNNRASAIPAGM